MMTDTERAALTACVEQWRAAREEITAIMTNMRDTAQFNFDRQGASYLDSALRAIQRYGQEADAPRAALAAAESVLREPAQPPSGDPHGLVWIPEGPGRNGLYANRREPVRGKVTDGSLEVSTYNPQAALWFRTRQACEAWCVANPTPCFEPRQHQFGAFGAEPAQPTACGWRDQYHSSLTAMQPAPTADAIGGHDGLEHGLAHVDRDRGTVVEGVGADGPVNAPTADAVPWTGPVWVLPFRERSRHDRTIADGLRDANGYWLGDVRAGTGDAIAAALNRDAAQAAEVAALRAACSKLNADVCQTLGAALGYPRFCDDQKNFPGAGPEHGVCVGDHVAESLAEEAATQIKRLAAENAQLREEHVSAEHQLAWTTADRDNWRRVAVRQNTARDAALARAEQAAREARRWAADRIASVRSSYSRNPLAHTDANHAVDQALIALEVIIGDGPQGEDT